MKSIVYVVVVLFIIACTSASSTEFYLKNQFLSSMKFKVATNNLLQNLYKSSNFKTICELSKVKTKSRIRFRSKPLESEEHYRYHTYDEIVAELNHLSKENSRYLIVETGQNLYNLPHPGGKCGNKQEKCSHYIAFLTDHEIYISGEVHGDEKVGPNVAIELIKLFLKHKNHNPWIKYLLETRLIVITPMTNPHGYDHTHRTELTSDNKYTDINRDFPYLVEKDKCMRTIGARLVNELYLSHIFSLALTLHGGTESLTYPFGSPNHIKGNKHEIPLEYTKTGNNVKTFPETESVVNSYRKGHHSHTSGTSTEAPDHKAMSGIANSASSGCGLSENKYKTGDMSSVVYPVTGGMEDWAYSGSWEGSPVITQPCTPKTYEGYDSEKTLYNKKYKDALKSIMFLLEISHNKIPPRESLGRRSHNDKCILNISNNAFNVLNKNSENENENLKENCLKLQNDGYINRVLRLSLTLIDLLIPYVNADINLSNGKDIKISWAVGGALHVSETYVKYNFVDKSEYVEGDQDLTEYLKNKSSIQSGKAVWGLNFKPEKDNFSITIPKDKQKKFIEAVVYAKVDPDWLKQENPIPNIHPQTHIVNLRNNSNYKAKNGKFILHGRDIFMSKFHLFQINK